MKIPSNLSEQVFNDLIRNPAFELCIISGGRAYSLTELVEIIALGISGRNELVESDPSRLHARMVDAIIDVVSKNANLNNLNSEAVTTVATLLANHVIAKAFLLNEGYGQ